MIFKELCDLSVMILRFNIVVNAAIKARISFFSLLIPLNPLIAFPTSFDVKIDRKSVV